MEYPKMIATGVAVIGRYQPRKLDAKRIGQHLIDITKNLQCEDSRGAWSEADWYSHKLSAEVRTTIANEKSRRSGIALPWHRDSQGKDIAMVLWSNREQTEIQLPDETVLKPDSYDIVIIRNTVVKHRTPPQVSSDRWFFRRFVKVPDFLR